MIVMALLTAFIVNESAIELLGAFAQSVVQVISMIGLTVFDYDVLSQGEANVASSV
jgi:hypothetical protein